MSFPINVFDFIRKNIKRIDIFLIIALSAIYFLSRLTNLLALPIFSDEGIYIRWARVAAYDPAWRFISLIDGKQPLQTWGTIPFIKIFPNDLLLAGRLFSVSTGFLALAGMMTLCGYLWGRRASYIAAILYLTTPFFLFYDRIALVDSGVNAAVIWILFMSIVLARNRRLDVAMIFGVVAGVGLLAKSSVLIFLALSAFGFIFIFESEKINPQVLLSLKKIREKLLLLRSKIISFYSLLFVTIAIAIALYLIQKLFSPFFHYIAEKNLTFILSPKEWLQAPFSLVPSNTRSVLLYVAWESGFLPLAFGIAGFFMLLKSRFYTALYIGLWIVIPFIMIINFNKVIYPRYLIFFPTLLTILSVAFFESIKDKKARFASILTTILILSALSYPIIFDVTKISFPPVDRGQYIEGQTAVWGADELMQIVRNDTLSGKPAIVLAEGNFGLIADVLEVMKKPNDKIYIEGYWPLNEEHILAKQNETLSGSVFVVFSHRTDFPVHWRFFMDEIKIFSKPGPDDSAVYLYKLKTQKLLQPSDQL